MQKRNKIVLSLVIALLSLSLFCLLFTFVPTFHNEMSKNGRYIQALSNKFLPLEGMNGQYIRQMITADSSRSRTIMWESTLDTPDALVEYRVAGSDSVQTVKAENKEFTDDQVTRYLHTAHLENLQPGSKYEYRVGFAEKRSDWKPLTTNQGIGNFKALIFPDSQSNDYSGWQSMARSAYDKNRDAQFFVNMGDLVDNGEDSSQWNAWFEAVTPLEENIPLATIMGNHETYNKQWKVREPLAYKALFDLPKNGDSQYPGQFYSFDFNDVHFVVLDTQFLEEESSPNLLNDEKRWLRQDLERSTAKWKVVLMHKDSLQYATTRSNNTLKPGFNDIGKNFMPIFDEMKVDAVLSAHYHTYRRRGHIKNFVRNAEGPLYLITGVAGNVRYDNLWVKHDLDEYVAPQPEVDNYLTFEEIDNRIVIKSFYANGSLMDETTLTK